MNSSHITNQKQDHDVTMTEPVQTAGVSVMSQLPQAQLQGLLAQFTPEQLAAVGQLYLSGALQLPTPPVPPPASALRSQPASDQSHDSGLEEGELDDDEPLTPPLEASHELYVENNVDTRAIRPGKRRHSSPRSDTTLKPTLGVQHFAQQQHFIEDFVRMMYASGHGYEKLKDEVSDPEQLRRIYERLSLPTQDSVPKTAQVLSKRPFAVKTQAPVDRQEYLARLQAAKNKKSEVPAVLPVSTSTAKPKKQLDPEKTNLLKQKLAARQAELAAREQQKVALTTASLSDAVSTTMPLPGTESGRSSVSVRPLDSNADNSTAQRLIINVSDDEDSDDSDDSELDDDSDNAGVPLQSHSHVSAVPASNAYELKMREIEAARQRVLEMEVRARSRGSAVPSPVTQTENSTEVPGLRIAVSQPSVVNQSAFTAAIVPNESSEGEAREDDDDAYDDIYSTVAAMEVAAPLPPIRPVELRRAFPSDDEAADIDLDDTEDFYDMSQPDAAPAEAPPIPDEMEEDDDAGDSDVSMDISESEDSSEVDQVDTSDDEQQPVRKSPPGAAPTPPLRAESASTSAHADVKHSIVEQATPRSELARSWVPHRSAAGTQQHKYFTEYESPLVTRTGLNGEKSHTIDTSTMVCPHETGFTNDSGICTEEDCPYQHFNQMGI